MYFRNGLNKLQHKYFVLKKYYEEVVTSQRSQGLAQNIIYIYIYI